MAFLKLFFKYTIPCCVRRPLDEVELALPDSFLANGFDPTVKGEVVRFKWDEIVSVTHNFAPALDIGQGGFSTVYLARVPPSSLTAIKVYHSSNYSERVHRAFRKEFDALSRTRHPNIVRLLGYCDDHDEGVLLLEYVPNGTLHDHLHGVGQAPVLSWAQRESIAFGIAEVIAYLHERCDPQIVHGDITAANILMDNRFKPKLCDFGSARAGFSAAVHQSGNTMLGTPGYTDPHYLRTGMISKKSDVYSFGVLLLELITGIPASRQAKRRLQAAEVVTEVGKIVDPKLQQEYDMEEAAAMAAVAVLCVGDQPGLRPSMAEVVRIMRGKAAPASISAVQGKSSGVTDL